jgi:hypothetical protein
MPDQTEPDEPYKEEISKLLDLAKFAMLCIMVGSGYLGASSLGIV